MRAAFCLLHVACVLAASSPSAPVLQTPSGAVRGFAVNGTLAFRGIPYAAPPVGDLRFRPPRPPLPWNGVLDATEFGASCFQIGGLKRWPGPAWNSLNVSKHAEDCLNLNVYVPQNRSALLPVMVCCGFARVLFAPLPTSAQSILHARLRS